MHILRGALLGVMLFTRVAWAEEPCFCLKDAHDNWLKGCRERLYGTAQQRTPFCDDPTKGVPRRIDTLQGWTRVLAEADGCAPCDDNRPRGPSGPRGDSATGAQHDDASPGTRPASK